MSVKAIDVTEQVEFENPDDETLPVTVCICGARFRGWAFTISIDPSTSQECPHCKRSFFFVNQVKVFQVVEEKQTWKVSKI